MITWECCCQLILQETDRLFMVKNMSTHGHLSAIADNHYPDILALYMFSENFAICPYTALYIKSLQDLFNFDELFVRIIMLEFPLSDVTLVYELMPRNSILVDIYHSSFNWPLRKIIEYREFMGLPPVGLLSLNHEQPWISQFYLHPDDVNIRNTQLNHVYKKFRFVLRNYYFSPLDASSHVFPLGSPHHAGIKPDVYSVDKSSFERKLLCSFRGRASYIYYSPFHTEREVLLQVSP